MQAERPRENSSQVSHPRRTARPPLPGARPKLAASARRSSSSARRPSPLASAFAPTLASAKTASFAKPALVARSRARSYTATAPMAVRLLHGEPRFQQQRGRLIRAEPDRLGARNVSAAIAATVAVSLARAAMGPHQAGCCDGPLNSSTAAQPAPMADPASVRASGSTLSRTSRATCRAGASNVASNGLEPLSLFR